MKKKVLLSSILTIALCLSLIAGSTYALFTAKSEVNIAITAGKLDFTAGISITNLWSVEPQDGGSIVDEKGGTYEYTYTDDAEFLNGGTAAVTNGNTLTITNITPGDKIDVAISGDNKSNVDTLYRYIIECTDGYSLMYGLVVYVTTQDANGQDVVTAYESLASYTSEWMFLEDDEDFTHPLTIELPVDAGNEYQGKTADIKITVEAVQGNASHTAAPAPTFISMAANAVEVEAALLDADTQYVLFTEDNMTIAFEDPTAISDKIIDLGGKNVVINLANTTLENVVITGVQSDDDATPAVSLSGATGDVTITDSYFYDHNSQPYGGVAGGNENLDVTFINCTFEGARPIYNSGNYNSLTIKNCVIKNTSSWAVLCNTAVIGDVVIDGCTFENCVGLFKVTKDMNGNFTFTNNKIVNNCTTKNDYYVDVRSYGTIIVAGNQMLDDNGVVVDDDMTADEMLGIVQRVVTP